MRRAVPARSAAAAVSGNRPSAPASTAGYQENADALAEQYESLSFAKVHRHVLHLFPAPPSRILDVGAGTGRDAAALARLGHTVVAVEPTPALRAHGQRLHADASLEWIDDSLPHLGTLRSGGRFDLVMLTAVWMHLDAAEREIAMATLVQLLAPAGLVVMSLRHGPVPEGRRMFEVSAAETCGLAMRHGLLVIHESEGGDTFGRPGVHWTRLAFRKPSPP
jgi:SAM-dependent methyltransferase